MKNNRKLSLGPLSAVLLLATAILFATNPQSPLFTGADATELIREFKELKNANEFLKKYSERNLELVINFLNNPMKHFSVVKEINDFGAYLGACEWILRETNRLQGSFLYGFVRRFFPNPDVTGVDILTFMRLNSWGSQAEELDWEYMRLFQTSPKVFIEYLEKRNDWRDVIDRTLGSASEYASIVEKLGDTEFERKLIDYITLRYDLKNYHPPLTLQENSVIFLSITQEELASLELDKPQMAAAIRKSLVDFEGQSKILISRLKKIGLVVESARCREVYFKYPTGSVLRMSMEMSDVFGVAVYKKGKAPMLMTGFKSEQLAGILSEYFQISLEKLREEREFIDIINLTKTALY